MNLRLLVKVAAMLVLGLIAIVLYADLQSVHQIYRITPAMINRAPDDATRGYNRDRGPVLVPSFRGHVEF
jgi:hypothetical protein